MSHTPKPDWKIKLRIRTKARGGFTPSNVDGYWYKFTGGNTSANNGDLEIDDSNWQAEGISVEISLKGRSKPKYTIKGGDLKNSSTDVSITGPSGNKVTIIDNETVGNETVNYGVTVSPNNKPELEIVCDPAIKHKFQ